MKSNLKNILKDQMSLLRTIKLLNPKKMTLDQINYNIGFAEDAELFSMIDPVLNIELNDKKTFNLFSLGQSDK